MKIVDKIPKCIHVIDTKWVYLERKEKKIIKRRQDWYPAVFRKYQDKILLIHTPQQFK